MNALTKSAAALATVTLFAAAAHAQAGMGPCMPMMMSGTVMPSCNSQPAPQTCPLPEAGVAKASDCAGNARMAGMPGGMAAGGMGIAMAVIGALFGQPGR